MLNNNLQTNLAEAHPVLIDLFKSQQAHEMTADQLTESCYYYTVDYVLEDYRWKPLPSKPYALMEYTKMTKDEKRELSDGKKAFIRKTYAEYEKGNWMLKTMNQTHLWWLKQCYECFEKRGDNAYMAKVQVLIHRHQEMGVK